MKPTKTQDAPSAQPAPSLVQCDITADTWERCRRDLHIKLARVITNSHVTSDMGVISRLVADIRAMELIAPTRATPRPEAVKPDPPDVAERKAAASNDAAMQAYNRKIARQESIAAAREEAGQ